ncbi:MAG: ATPase [Deltaproteobacteria bacterium]|nr:ATPase [Deltaproteobacteria bacterium]
MMFRKRILKLHPATLILLSFLLVIIIGTLLLKLPVSTRGGHITWIDALFTSTSAVCVTGLIVVDTGSFFTLFGQSVILILIQIGGLGVMTISVAMFRWIGKSISFRHRMVMQDVFAHTPREDILGLVKSTIFFTLGAEILGTIFLSIYWGQRLPFLNAVYTALFHSISAFCNAGFSLFSDSMSKYGSSIFLNTVMCLLIVIGGIGFPVLYDVQSWFKIQKNKRLRLSVQTKTVLVTTILLIAGGAIMFAFLEHHTLDESASLSHRILISIFQSITCRTAGFNTVDIGSLRDVTLFLMIFLMFIGASPGSCGGGVKTTTLALISAFTLSKIRGKKRVNIFKKSIPVEAVNRSISLILVSFCVIGIILFMLLMDESPGPHNISDNPRSFLAYFFETVSAFGTVGLSMGVTPELSTWSKLWLNITMIIGRVGVLTFSYIIVSNRSANGIEYSEENLMIG